MVESKNCIDNQAPEVFQGYKRISVLGSGTFGIVFKYQKNDQIISIKFSKPNSYSNDCLNEAIIMRKMTEDGRHGFFPKYIKNGCTKVNDKIVNYLMMEYLDEQINAINDSQNSNQFDFQDGLDQIGQKLFVSMITVVQQLHNSGYIHRDIKPSNFMMKDGKVYIIDFGLSKQYLKDGVHCDQLEQIQQLKGSPFFASLNSHNLIDISRRDDLESLAYTFLYIINLLPWVNKQDMQLGNYQTQLELNNQVKLQKEDLQFNIISNKHFDKFNEEPPYENLRQVFLNSHDQISNNKDEQMALPESNYIYQELKQKVSLFKKNPSDEFILLNEYESKKILKIIDSFYSIINFHKDIDITVRLSLDSINKDYKNIEITKETTVQFMSEIYGWNNGQDMILNEEERSYEFQISRQIWQDLANKQLNKRKR
ncbi:ck1 family protein kinase [Stylonychia lemnae]|uniref:Casein kinase I n=1 Tax=Stylonychia lemnae TaxID=5949 RepID=A0A078A5B5_STYLE|nr:ck1 family protein kinase [Stylonychia lemnae]|eukprot:CDW77079.1 ck1 family protein kinase [Stylonychia lemnae]